MTSLPLRNVLPLLVQPGASVRESMARIEAGGVGLALVVDADGRLLATLSDGDIRRALLGGATLEQPVAGLGNPHPVSASSSAWRGQLRLIFRERRVRQIPLLDESRRPVAICVADDLTPVGRSNIVVIMAGGRGSRLGELTAETPKPLLPVGGRPILETLIDQLANDGFGDFLIAVNYRSDRIVEHFGDGTRLGVRIGYLEEREPLGTAGALRLAADRLTESFLVLNADLLTSMSFGEFLDAHRARANALTLTTTDVEVQVRYGIVESETDRVSSLREKPTIHLTANAGIYAAEPVVLDYVPLGPSNMPEVVGAVLAANLPVGRFSVQDLWLDVGEIADLERAQSAYRRVWSGEVDG